MTLTKTDVSTLLHEHSIHPSRVFGQNFVVDPNTVRRIVRLAAVERGDHVLEIGPGVGSLTLALVEAGADIDVLEIDTRLIPVLQAVVAPHGVRIHEGDALTFDVGSVCQEPTALIANLPYNVATPLVIRMLETVPTITRMLVMVQREVGERYAAQPGDEAYGSLSMRVNYFATAKVVGMVPPTVFTPQPKVESALVSITRREVPAIDPSRLSDADLFEPIRLAFAQRRKMIRRTLHSWATPGTFERAGVLETRRPEELSLEDFARLAESR